MNKFKVGDKIHFEGERNAYTIRACDSRYLICTKPFNPRKTVLYTIVDLQEKVRGTENLVFCMGFETDKIAKKHYNAFNPEKQRLVIKSS